MLNKIFTVHILQNINCQQPEFKVVRCVFIKAQIDDFNLHFPEANVSTKTLRFFSESVC